MIVMLLSFMVWPPSFCSAGSRTRRSPCGGRRTGFAVVLRTTPAAGNGGHFLISKDAAKAELMYFGEVKDEKGHPLGEVTIDLEVEGKNVTFTTITDAEGHYETVDLGKNVKPGSVTISAREEGYKQVEPKGPVPEKTGAVEINFKLARE